MKIEQELITPAKAAELLKKNKRNRTLRPRHVMKLARAIERGEWQATNPAPIVVNSNKLLDGQHRLAAVIEAKKAVKMWVARGAPTGVMATMDTGLARTFTDTLKLQNEQYPSTLAAILRQVYLYKTERMLGGKADRQTPSHAELLGLLEEHPEIRDIANQQGAQSVAKHTRGLGSPALVGAFYWVVMQIDKDDADSFVHQLLTGEDLELGHPILALRRVMLESRRRPKPRVLGALMIKSWNAWREGENAYLLSWKGGGKSPEPFPILR